FPDVWHLCTQERRVAVRRSTSLSHGADSSDTGRLVRSLEFEVSMVQQPITTIPGTDLSLLGEEHVRVYRETNGEKGYIWNGVPILLLATTGRKTGQPRTIAIIYTAVDDKYVIIASKGGSPTHPK